MLASHAAGRRDATRGAGIPAGTGRIKHGLSSDNGGKKERDFLSYEASTVTPARPLARQTSAAARASGTCRSAR